MGNGRMAFCVKGLPIDKEKLTLNAMSEKSKKTKTDSDEGRMHRMLRMTIFVDKSFAPIFTMRFTPLSLVVGGAATILVLITGVTLLIAFTGLREYIPGYPTGEERLIAINNLQRADSLAREIDLRDNMLSNLRLVLSGNVPTADMERDTMQRNSNAKGITKQSLVSLNNGKSDEENAFLSQIETAEKFDVEDDNSNTPLAGSELESTFFFAPIKGMVSDRFGMKVGHYGVDVSSDEGTPIMSTLDGTVIYSEWSLQTGYVIMVQHDNQLVSVYKHNAKLLKVEGARVRAGEAIALSGNSGEFSTGPHLHFELWYMGVPLNPEDYINFEKD